MIFRPVGDSGSSPGPHFLVHTSPPGGGGGGLTTGGLIERGAYLKSYIFDEIHNNFPNFTFTPITKTEQEIGFCIIILQMQRHLFPISTLLLEIKTNF